MAEQRLDSATTIGSPGERALETHLAQLAPDLPPASREYRFAPHRGYRFDFAWPAQRVACEVDGGQWAAGGGRHATDADRDKLNLAAVLGWRVLRFSPAMLARNPDQCVRQIRAALEGETND
jgi:very-short-patch-repair endonuclease